MAMHNLPHPGEFIIQVYVDPNNLSGCELVGKLGVAASTLNRILTGTSLAQPIEMTMAMSVFSENSMTCYTDRNGRIRLLCGSA